MAGLRDVLQKDLQNAMRARDEHRKSALRMVLLAVQLAEAEHGPPSDDEIHILIQKEIKRRLEALELMRHAGRTETESDELAQMEILRAYLPLPLPEEELVELARSAISEVNAASQADINRVMQALMPRVRGRADGRQVNQIVRELLSV